MNAPDPVFALDDPNVPDAIRDQAADYRTPVVWVEDLGFGEYALFSEDGELIDLVFFRGLGG